MVIQRAPFVFRAQQTTDHIIALTALGATLHHDLGNCVVKTFDGDAGLTSRFHHFARVNLVTADNGQGPGGVLLVLGGIIRREAHQGVHDANRQFEAELHQVGLLGRQHRLDVLLADHLIDLRTPFVDGLRHKCRLQQGTHLAMFITVHGKNDQTIEKRTQTFGNKTTGIGRAIAQNRHHVLILEQSEGRASALLGAGIGRDAKLSDEIAFIDRRFQALLTAYRMNIQVSTAIQVRHGGIRGCQVQCCTFVAHQDLLSISYRLRLSVLAHGDIGEYQ
ncbi:hypothetical protein D3C84_737610 [compost metagenome]